ncbi:MAG TPA: GspE/PulE family protein [Acidobacteria bacterium]|nr:GspE/PulE family protein [Acidobacteriota bacterium]
MSHAVETARIQTETPRIGKLLLDRGLITSDQLRKALILQKSQGKRLGDILVEMGAVPAETMRQVLSELHDVPAVDLDRTYGDPFVLDILPKEKAFQLKAIPLFLVENQLTVALPDPDNIAKLDEIQFQTGKQVLPVLALESDIDRHLKEYYGELDPWSDEVAIEFESLSGTPVDPTVALDEIETDRPLIRLVNLIIARAVQERASDIHVEPQEQRLVIRYRIDGRLQVKPFNLPASVAAAVVSRMKILSQLDIAEKRVPQDGKVRVRYKGRRIDIRTSTFPTIYGEKVVMRLLDKERQDFRLENIGMSEPILKQWRNLMRRHEGIILVTGPTGSGKSSTLYATLRGLNTPDVNIVTLEDPVEYELQGISQGQVLERAGFTFAKGLRSILRQDPDIVLVGEIRDLETAQIAVQAALTGHLVLSTLHTNDSPSTIIRLADMGVPRFLVGASVIGILAQRLVRKVCPHCVEEVDPPPEEGEILRPWLEMGIPYREGKGCDRCRGIGYSGRTGVHELIVVDRDLQARITAGDDLETLARHARRTGYRPMWWDGLEKVVAGITTLGELARSVQADEERSGNTTEGGRQHGPVQEPS